MRPGRLAAGVAATATAAGAVVVARSRRGPAERVEIRYDDGAAVSLDRPSAERDALLAHAREALAAVRA
jgi:hypothetical protein